MQQLHHRISILDGLMMQMTSPKSNSGESNDQQGPSPSQEARRSSIDPARQAALNTLYATALYPSSGQFDRITEETGLSLKTVKVSISSHEVFILSSFQIFA